MLTFDLCDMRFDCVFPFQNGVPVAGNFGGCYFVFDSLVFAKTSTSAASFVGNWKNKEKN